MKLRIYSIIFFALFACQSPPTTISHYSSPKMAEMDLPFSEAVRIGDMLYLSGQIGNVPGKMEMLEGGVKAETTQIMENIKRVLEANGSSLDHSIKFTIMMADMSEWAAMNEVYATYFPNNKPARSAFGTSGLALGARLEIECIAYIP